MKKLLFIFFIYQITSIQNILTGEIEIKESSEMKIVKKYFDPLARDLNKEELKAWLLLAAIPGISEKILCKRPSLKSNPEMDLYEATKIKDYKTVRRLLKEGKNPMKGYPVSTFELATNINNLYLKKLFIWNNDIPPCYFMLDDALIFIKGKEFKKIANFMMNYAPKISRIKNEEIIQKINKIISTLIENQIKLPTVLNQIIGNYCFYPEDSFKQVKLTYQDIDEIIYLYDSEFNKNNENYKRLISEAKNGLKKIEIFEDEEEITQDIEEASRKKALRKLQRDKMRSSSCYCKLM